MHKAIYSNELKLKENWFPPPYFPLPSVDSFYTVILSTFPLSGASTHSNYGKPGNRFSRRKKSAETPTIKEVEPADFWSYKKVIYPFKWIAVV